MISNQSQRRGGSDHVAQIRNSGILSATSELDFTSEEEAASILWLTHGSSLADADEKSVGLVEIQGPNSTDSQRLTDIESAH